MQDDEYEGDLYDMSLDQYKTYEDYLNANISPDDLKYLEDEELARQLLEVGYHGKGEILDRQKFKQKKEAAAAARKAKEKSIPKELASANKDLSGFPFLQALSEREEMVRNGRLSTIIFIREQKPGTKKEISGYIDYAHRLKTENFELYFERKKRLLPKPSDLSYYDWDTQHSVSNDSPNFSVDANSEVGLLFKNKRDRKLINVDPNKPPGDNTKRVEIATDEYVQVVLYDHMTRRKN